MATFITLDNLATFLAQCKELFALSDEVYSKVDVDALVGAIKSFSYEAVSLLPTASSSTVGKIYLVPSAKAADKNIKDEFITIQDGGSYKWEQIGSTAIDLTGYVTDTDLNAIVATLATKSELNNVVYQEEGEFEEDVEDAIINRVVNFEATKQDKLVPGVNIKTINGESILGEGNIEIKGGGADGAYIKPSTGIPATDLSDDVQTTLNKVGELYADYQAALNLI